MDPKGEISQIAARKARLRQQQASCGPGGRQRRSVIDGNQRLEKGASHELILTFVIDHGEQHTYAFCPRLRTFQPWL